MRRAKKVIKTGTSLGLVLALVFLFSTSAFASRPFIAQKGVSLQIIKKDGGSVAGELIAVRGRTLILVDDSTLADVSLQLEEVSQIIIKRKSGALAGAVLGLALGGAIGGHLGAASAKSDRAGGLANLWKAMAGLGGAVVGALGGALIGAGIGAAMSQDKKFLVVDMNQEMQDKLLKKLRSESRFPNEH